MSWNLLKEILRWMKISKGDVPICSVDPHHLQTLYGRNWASFVLSSLYFLLFNLFTPTLFKELDIILYVSIQQEGLEFQNIFHPLQLMCKHIQQDKWQLLLVGNVKKKRMIVSGIALLLLNVQAMSMQPLCVYNPNKMKKKLLDWVQMLY